MAKAHPSRATSPVLPSLSVKAPESRRVESLPHCFKGPLPAPHPSTAPTGLGEVTGKKAPGFQGWVPGPTPAPTPDPLSMGPSYGVPPPWEGMLTPGQGVPGDSDGSGARCGLRPVPYAGSMDTG